MHLDNQPTLGNGHQRVFAVLFRTAKLRRRLEDITAMEIIEVLDGPVALTACVEGAEDACNVESLCPMRGGWEKVNGAIRRALTEVTLAELCPPRDFTVAAPVQTKEPEQETKTPARRGL